MIWHEYKDEDIDKILNLNPSDFNKWVSKTMHATCTSCGRNYLYWKNSPALKQEYWKLILEKLDLVEFEKKATANFEKFRKATNNTSVFATRESIIKTICSIIPSDCHCTICDICMEKAIGEPLSEKHVDTECELGLTYLNNKNNDN